MDDSDSTETRTTPKIAFSVQAASEASCRLKATRPDVDTVTSNLFSRLEDAGCPLAPAVRERLRFETLLAELSAKFVNVCAAEVDSQIESGLRRIVEMLGLDRSGLGEVSADGKRFVVTHSYQLPGVPPSSALGRQLSRRDQELRSFDATSKISSDGPLPSVFANQ